MAKEYNAVTFIIPIFGTESRRRNKYSETFWDIFRRLFGSH